MKSMFCFIIVALSFLFSPFYFAQSVNLISDDKDERLSRVHFTSGYNKMDQYSYGLFNVSYHFTGLRRNSTNFNIDFSFESGINCLISNEQQDFNVTDFKFYFLPYAQLGPEFGINDNLFFNVNVGGSLYSYRGGNAFVPFYGLNTTYLFHFNDNFGLEFETGLNATLLTYRPITFFYVTIGLAII
jgi:hypothetical protein